MSHVHAMCALLLAGGIASCSGPGSELNIPQTRQEIVDQNARWSDAMKKGDTAAIGSLYTDGASLLPPGGPYIIGRDGIEQFYGSVFKQGVTVTGAEVTTADVGGKPNLAYETGTYVMTIKVKSGASEVDSGRYSIVWKKEGDLPWKMQVHIWNSNRSR